MATSKLPDWMMGNAHSRSWRASRALGRLFVLRAAAAKLGVSEGDGPPFVG